MSEIRRLKDEEFKAWIEISMNAYPGFAVYTEEAKQKQEERLLKIQNEDPNINFYGVFREGKLVGGMRLHDFTMNMLSEKISAGGLGSVAVDLLHKKEKIAKEIVQFFLEHYQQRGVSMTMLYPFRPDFYKRMGFGFGTKLNQYKIKPADLPKGSHKRNIEFYSSEHMQRVLDCYNRYMEKTHGIIEMTEAELEGLIGRAENKAVVCKKEDEINGFMLFSFVKANEKNSLVNDIFVKLFVYEDDEAFMEMMTFLNTQSDQISRVIFNTADEYFHHLLSDPRDDSDNLFVPVYHQTNVQGVGLMYKVVDVEGLFGALAQHDFNGQSCKLKLSVEDSFIPENGGSTIIHFNNGISSVCSGEDDFEAEISMDISDFSSMIVGAIGFKELLRLGLAGISDRSLAETVDKLFRTEGKPVCTTLF